MTDDGTMTRHEAHDGNRLLTFTGTLLGEGSSKTPGKERWTEARIYRTEIGNYVVEITGVSVVPGESNRARAQVCETARGAVESLYVLDDDQVRFIPRVNRVAAELAASLDAEFSQAFYVEEVA